MIEVPKIFIIFLIIYPMYSIFNQILFALNRKNDSCILFISVLINYSLSKFLYVFFSILDLIYWKIMKSNRNIDMYNYLLVVCNVCNCGLGVVFYLHNYITFNTISAHSNTYVCTLTKDK